MVWRECHLVVRPRPRSRVLTILTTGLIGFEGLILEEDMACGGIASVLIFRQT